MANELAEYVQKLQKANPEEAVKIALAETERVRALAQHEQTEYKMLSEIEFDTKGAIAKANMAGLWRLAQMYAGSLLVPEQYRNRPHDCFIACQMALRLRIDPFAYMQSSYVVYGRPGVEAKLAIAMLNTSGKIKGRVRYEDKRDAKGVMIACTAIAKDAESEADVSATVTWEMVEAEGWHSKNGSKWKTIREVMFRYRSASFLIKQFYPEVLLGMDFKDELDDMGSSVEVNGSARTVSELGDRINANGAGTNGSHAANGNTVVVESKPAEKSEEKPEATDPPTKKNKKKESAKVTAPADSALTEEEMASLDEKQDMKAWSEGMGDDPTK